MRYRPPRNQVSGGTFDEDIICLKACNFATSPIR